MTDMKYNKNIVIPNNNRHLIASDILSSHWYLQALPLSLFMLTVLDL